MGRILALLFLYIFNKILKAYFMDRTSSDEQSGLQAWVHIRHIAEEYKNKEKHFLISSDQWHTFSLTAMLCISVPLVRTWLSGSADWLEKKNKYKIVIGWVSVKKMCTAKRENPIKWRWRGSLEMTSYYFPVIHIIMARINIIVIKEYM